MQPNIFFLFIPKFHFHLLSLAHLFDSIQIYLFFLPDVSLTALSCFLNTVKVEPAPTVSSTATAG
jgi:hypothetical protein